MTTDRFVILHHLAPTGEHWDFMLERDGVLATWQMPAEPTGPGACPIECLRIKDHRKQYLDYQGPVSGGRGFVDRVDLGRYELLAAEPEAWTIRLSGRRLRGDYTLSRTPDSAARWTFDTL